MEFLLCVVSFFLFFFLRICRFSFSSDSFDVVSIVYFPLRVPVRICAERFISDDTWKWSICISQAAERGSVSIAREVFSSIFKTPACYFIPRSYRKFALDKLRLLNNTLCRVRQLSREEIREKEEKIFPRISQLRNKCISWFYTFFCVYMVQCIIKDVP